MRTKRILSIFALGLVAAILWWVFQVNEAKKNPAISEPIAQAAGHSTSIGPGQTLTETKPPSIAAVRPQPDTGQIIVVENMALPSPAVTVNKAQYERLAAIDQKNLEEIIRKDMTDGINAEVRERETQLRRLAQNLRIGMAAHQVIETFGQPELVRIRQTNGLEFQYKEIPLTNQLKVAQDTFVTYSPRTGLKFNGKNGQGYQVLHLHFSAQGQLMAWQWRMPFNVIHGSLNMTRKQGELLQGKRQD